MITLNSFRLLSFLFLITLSPLYSQSIGIIYEASSFNYDTRNQYEEPYRGQIKNFFFNFNGPLPGSFQYSLRIGYGWNKYGTVTRSNTPLVELNSNKIKTHGFPIETEIRYQKFMGADSIFEPLIGIGLGYYNYRTEFEHDGNVSSNPYKTNGFGQYITFGLNFHLSKKIISNIQFKKIMVNDITTESSTENESYEWDYVQQRGINDISVSLGIFFEFR